MGGYTVVASSARPIRRKLYSKPTVDHLDMQRFAAERQCIEDLAEEAAEEAWARDCGPKALTEDCVPWSKVRADLGL